MYSNILNQLNHGISQIVLQSLHMDPLFSPSPLLHNNSGSNSSQCIRIRLNIKLEAPWALGHKTPSRMLSASCQAPPILLIPRVNTQFLEVSIDTHSTQRLSHLYRETAICQYLSLCHITGPLTSLTMPTLLLLNNNLEPAWGITWQDRVQITLCLRIMHRLIWLKDL